MRETRTVPESRGPAAYPSDYVRFIILSGPRTGSHMLAQALNSSPHIRCFREVFNGRLDFVDFSVDGYDNFNSRDIVSRKGDPVRFLRERVFCRHPAETRAVGFKFLYEHHWDFPGLLDELVEDRDLMVLHLRRRNSVRMLVSLKIAEETGIWVKAESKVTKANLLKALRHPLKAVGRMRWNLQRPEQPKDRRQARVTITLDELFKFSVGTHLTGKQFDKLFREHQVLPVFYEDLVDNREPAFAQVQSFLGVEPESLAVTLRRQNPEPLSELLGNYDELYAELKDSPVAWFME